LIHLANRKPSYSYRKKDKLNKKAIIWVGSILVAFILFMVILLIWNP